MVGTNGNTPGKLPEVDIHVFDVEMWIDKESNAYISVRVQASDELDAVCFATHAFTHICARRPQGVRSCEIDA